MDKLTDEMIAGRVLTEAFYTFPGTGHMVCSLTMADGRHVSGESQTSPESYDEQLSQTQSRHAAYVKVRNLAVDGMMDNLFPDL